jgi:hypothetical protein
MIDIRYEEKEIKVYTQNVSSLYELPLKLVVSNQVTSKEIWSCELGDYSWASFPNKEMNNCTIYDNNGKVIMRKRWDVMNDGDYLYKTIYFYCNKLIRQGINPNGLAVGTHDGAFGEWVPLVLDGITRATLVEASKPQFEKLQNIYNDFEGVTLVNSLVTVNGEPSKFYEGGKGYTNTLVERVIESWESEPYSGSLKESTSVNEIISNMDRFDWLHLDVEGYDATLIKGCEKLPNLIIFENNNLLDNERNEINQYLIDMGYTLQQEFVSTIALK